MKKFTVILLACLYLASVFGVRVSRFYCCGDLKSLDVSLAIFQTEKQKDDSCCKHTQTVIKVSDSHQQSLAVYNFAGHFADGCCLPACSQASYFRSSTFFASSNFSNGPPLQLVDVPLYIRHCTYRI